MFKRAVLIALLPLPAFGGIILSVVPGSLTSSVSISAEAALQIDNGGTHDILGPDVRCSAFGIFSAAVTCDSTLPGRSEESIGTGKVDATGFHLYTEAGYNGPGNGIPSFANADVKLDFKEQLVITGGAGSGYLVMILDRAEGGFLWSQNLKLGSADRDEGEVITPFDYGVQFPLTFTAEAFADQSDYLSYAGLDLRSTKIFDSSAACAFQTVYCLVDPGMPFTGGFFDPTALAPEPGTWVMLLGGMAWMWRARWKRRL
jgi:hypothetical protein